MDGVSLLFYTKLFFNDLFDFVFHNTKCHPEYNCLPGASGRTKRNEEPYNIDMLRYV